MLIGEDSYLFCFVFIPLMFQAEFHPHRSTSGNTPTVEPKLGAWEPAYAKPGNLTKDESENKPTEKEVCRGIPTRKDSHKEDSQRTRKAGCGRQADRPLLPALRGRRGVCYLADAAEERERRRVCQLAPCQQKQQQQWHPNAPRKAQREAGRGMEQPRGSECTLYPVFFSTPVCCCTCGVSLQGALR